MTYKKYKIKNKFTNQNHTEFELSGDIEFSDGKKNSIFCINKYPFKDYQVGEEIEINLVNAKRVTFKSYHQGLVRKISQNYTSRYHDDHIILQEENETKIGLQQSQVQKQMSAYQKEVAYRKFQSAMKWLEKFVEIAYGDQFPDWENRKQFRKDGIPRTDIIGNPERTEKLFTFALYGLEGYANHPDLQAKMKEEFYQWISATRIDVNNCPDKLKYYLFGFSEILEGRGEKIVAEGDNRKPAFDVDSPEFSKGLNEFFASLHSGPIQEARERESSLKGKNYNDLEVGSKFVGNEEEGKNAFQRIKDYVSSSLNYRNFHFFPQKGVHQTCSEVVQDIKTSPQNWRLDEIPVEVDNFGRTKRQEWLLINNKDAKEDYNQEGKLNFDGNPLYRWESFDSRQRFEIKLAKNILGSYSTSDEIEWVIKEVKDNPRIWKIEVIKGQTYLIHSSAQINDSEIGTLIHNQKDFSMEGWTKINKAFERAKLIDDIKQSAKLERGLCVIDKINNSYSENEDWFISNQLKREFDNETGYLIYVPNAMFRTKYFTEAEQKEIKAFWADSQDETLEGVAKYNEELKNEINSRQYSKSETQQHSYQTPNNKPNSLGKTPIVIILIICSIALFGIITYEVKKSRIKN